MPLCLRMLASSALSQVFIAAYKFQLNSVKYYNWRIQIIMVTRRHIHTDCFVLVKYDVMILSGVVRGGGGAGGANAPPQIFVVPPLP